MNTVKQISKQKANEIIETRKPLGAFYFEEGGKFIGIDNTAGDSFVEEFKDKESCIGWLSDSNIIYHTQFDYGKTLQEIKESQESEDDRERYEVVIKEELVTSKVVRAKSKEEAIQKVQDMYENEEVTLDWSDFNDVTFKADRV